MDQHNAAQNAEAQTEEKRKRVRESIHTQMNNWVAADARAFINGDKTFLDFMAASVETGHRFAANHLFFPQIMDTTSIDIMSSQLRLISAALGVAKTTAVLDDNKSDISAHGCVTLSRDAAPSAEIGILAQSGLSATGKGHYQPVRQELVFLSGKLLKAARKMGIDTVGVTENTIRQRIIDLRREYGLIPHT